METKRVRIGADRLCYNEVAGEGPPLLMLHGLTGHRDDFAWRMPDLEGEARLIAPDLRGHGDFTRTGRAETFTFEQLVADLRDLLDHLGVARCHLLGHSFGGMVALRFALEHPTRVASLVPMCTAPEAPDTYTASAFERGGAIAVARGMAFLQELVEKRARESGAAADALIAKWGDLYWPHHRRRYLAMDPTAYGALGVLMVEQTPVVARLGEIRCPTTLLFGAADAEFRRGADPLEKGIAQAVRVTIPEAGHHPHMENPPAWLAALRAHLGRARR